MEETVAAELAIIQGAEDDEEKERQLDERLQELGELLKKGIEAAARDMRLSGAFIEPGHDDGTVWLDRLFAIYLPRLGQVNGQLNYAQLQQGVAQAIREKALAFDAPRISVNAGRLTVIDVGLSVESPRRLARIEEVACELAKLELRRRHPVPQPASRAIMESVYGQMEQVIRQRLDELRQAGAASADAASTEVAAAATGGAEQPDAGEDPPVDRSPFGRKLDGILKQGLERCAQSMGNLRLDFSNSPNATGSPTRSVRLGAPAGTKIEFVHNTDHKLWTLAGKAEGEYPWVERRGGDTVELAGGYWFRLTYPGGRQIRLYKKTGVKDTDLRFPEP
ncbi:MAG TPA: hypothetical protein VG826_04350 [Pirellulales bacterium]|nr:hypothetical protein [Pirellulales bacterium]